MKVVELLIVNVTQHTSLVEVMKKGKGRCFEWAGVFFFCEDESDPSLRVVFSCRVFGAVQIGQFFETRPPVLKVVVVQV